MSAPETNAPDAPAVGKPPAQVRVTWAGVGTAVRHDNTPETLNLLDGRPAGPGLGPSLNLWALPR